MKILELKTEDQKLKLLDYLKMVEWGAARYLEHVLEVGQVREKMGEDARIFYAIEGEQMAGFFTLVNQDYIPMESLDRFIAMVWVDPKYRGRGLSKKFVAYAEEASGVDEIHILTQHKGLYEKMGYQLIREIKGSIHDRDYLYRKQLK